MYKYFLPKKYIKYAYDTTQKHCICKDLKDAGLNSRLAILFPTSSQLKLESTVSFNFILEHKGSIRFGLEISNITKVNNSCENCSFFKPK
jgi:hypothetical protein